MTKYHSTLLSGLRHTLMHCMLLCFLLTFAPAVDAQDDIPGPMPADTLRLAGPVTQHPIVPGDAPVDSVWAAANRFYQQRDWEQALDLYSRLEQSGLASASLYYNIGNVHFRTNDIKRAILYYCRAQRLAPRDEDIAYNLELANTFITDKIETVDELFLLVWLRHTGNCFTLPQWTRLSLVLFGLALLAAAAFLLSGRRTLKYLSFWACCLCMALCICSFAGALYQYKTVTNQHEAIVFSASVTVKSSPNENGNNLFIVHEGTKLHIEDRVGDWCGIRLPDGNKGWMPLSALEII